MAIRTNPLVQQFAANVAAKERQAAGIKAAQELAQANMYRQMAAGIATQGVGLFGEYIADEYFPTAQAGRETLASQLAAAEAARAMSEQQREAGAFALGQAKVAADQQKQQDLLRFEDLKPGLLQPTVSRIGALAGEQAAPPPVAPMMAPPRLGAAAPTLGGAPRSKMGPGAPVPPADVQRPLQLRPLGDVAGKPMAAGERAGWEPEPARPVEGPRDWRPPVARPAAKAEAREFKRTADAVKTMVERSDKKLATIVNKLPARFEKMTDNQKIAYVRNRMSNVDRANAALKVAAYVAQVTRADILKNVPIHKQDAAINMVGNSLTLAKEWAEFKFMLKRRGRGGKGRRRPPTDYDPKFVFSKDKEKNSQMVAFAALNPYVSLPKARDKSGKVTEWSGPIPTRKAWKMGQEVQAMIESGQASIKVKGGKRLSIHPFSPDVTSLRRDMDPIFKRQTATRRWQTKQAATEAIARANAAKDKDARQAQFTWLLESYKHELRSAESTLNHERAAQLKQVIALVSNHTALASKVSAAKISAIQASLQANQPVNAKFAPRQFQYPTPAPTTTPAPAKEKSALDALGGWLSNLAPTPTPTPAIQGEEVLRKKLFNQALKTFPGQGDAARRAKYVKAKMDGKTDKQAKAEASR